MNLHLIWPQKGAKGTKIKKHLKWSYTGVVASYKQKAA
jgi:hypothetical protein